MTRQLVRSFFDDEAEYFRFFLHLKQLTKATSDGLCIAELTKEDGRYKYVLTWHSGEFAGDYVAPFRANKLCVAQFNLGCDRVADLLDKVLDGVDLDSIDLNDEPFGELTWREGAEVSKPQSGNEGLDDQEHCTPYFPHIESADTVEEFEIGRYRVALLKNIKASGIIRYMYAMAAFDKESANLCYVVAAEVCGDPDGERRGCFLCSFPGEGHINHGLSAEWADLGAFKRQATIIITGALMPVPQAT